MDARTIKPLPAYLSLNVGRIEISIPRGEGIDVINGGNHDTYLALISWRGKEYEVGKPFINENDSACCVEWL